MTVRQIELAASPVTVHAQIAECRRFLPRYGPPTQPQRVRRCSRRMMSSSRIRTHTRK